MPSLAFNSDTTTELSKKFSLDKLHFYKLIAEKLGGIRLFSPLVLRLLDFMLRKTLKQAIELHAEVIKRFKKNWSVIKQDPEATMEFLEIVRRVKTHNQSVIETKRKLQPNDSKQLKILFNQLKKLNVIEQRILKSMDDTHRVPISTTPDYVRLRNFKEPAEV